MEEDDEDDEEEVDWCWTRTSGTLNGDLDFGVNFFFFEAPPSSSFVVEAGRLVPELIFCCVVVTIPQLVLIFFLLSSQNLESLNRRGAWLNEVRSSSLYIEANFVLFVDPTSIKKFNAP